MTLSEKGNKMSQVKKYFDTAIALQPGQKLLIPAQSYNNMESLRVQLISERRKWRKSTLTTEDLTIGRQQQGKRCFVLIEKVGPAAPAMILDENDEIVNFITIQKTIDIAEKIETTELPMPLEEDEETRMRTLMAEDGMSQEEIDAYFKGGDSDDEAGTDPEVA